MRSSSLSDYAIPALLLVLGLLLSPLRVMGPDLARLPGEPCAAGIAAHALEGSWKWFGVSDPPARTAVQPPPGEASGLASREGLLSKDASARISPDALAVLPVYGAFRLAGLDREGAYQGLFLALFVLGYACAHVGLRRLGLGPSVSGLAALAFAIAGTALGAAYDPALASLFPAPLAVCCLVRWAREGALKDFALLCAAVTAQFYCSLPLGALLCASLGLLALGWLAVKRRMGPAWDVFQGEKIAVCLGLVALAVSPLAWARSGPFWMTWTVPPVPAAFAALPSCPDLFAAAMAGSAATGGMASAGLEAAAGFLNDPALSMLPILAGVAAAFLTMGLGLAARRALGRITSPAGKRAAFAVALAAVAAASYSTDLKRHGFNKAEQEERIGRMRAHFAALPTGAQLAAYIPGPVDPLSPQSAVTAMLAAQDAGLGAANVAVRLFPAGLGVFLAPDCSQVGAWMLGAWAATGRDAPMADAPKPLLLAAAGPGATADCLPSPMDAAAARSELLRRYTALGEATNLILALGMKGFAPTAKGGLILQEAGELTLNAWEGLSLEGIGVRPVSVRLFADGKPTGRLEFFGSPTRVTLSAPARPVRYRLVIEQGEMSLITDANSSAVVFAKAVFRPAHAPQ